MKCIIEDLGIAGHGEAHLDWNMGIMARHPRTGAEFVIHPTFEHGFLVIDPRARTGFHVQPDFSVFEHTSRGLVQAADGSILTVGCRAVPRGEKQAWSLLRWNWEGQMSIPIEDFSRFFVVVPQIDCDTRGRVYLWNSGSDLYQLDPASHRLEVCAKNVGQVVCGRDGLVYIVDGGGILALDPAREISTPVAMADGSPCARGLLRKDGAGRVVLPVEMSRREGRVFWLELRDGKAVPVDASVVRLCETVLVNNEVGLTEPYMRMVLPYVFQDGTYFSRLVENEVTLIDARGRPHTFAVERKDTPLRLFSIQAGGGRLWMGSILPLLMISYDPQTNTFTNHGTPTLCVGEIYNMAWSGERLFMASYPRCFLTRFDPSRPVRYDRSVQANPAQLGLMKNGSQPPNRSLDPAIDPPLTPSLKEGSELYLHRALGKAMDRAGNVYFSAHGDYGCVDSGICRIDRQTEEVTRWIYPETFFGSLIYLAESDRLLVCERRKGEEAIRFTFISPENGRVIHSAPVISDGGLVTTWLHDGGDLVYGLHDHRATIFAYSLSGQKIVRKIAELGVGHHCYEALIFGPDGRIWGLTRECLFAVDRELTAKERLADYPDHANGNFNRFGFCYGPDKWLYFLNGAHLMRARW